HANPGCGASCGAFFRPHIAVELAEQGISVFLRPIGQMLDEILNLLPSCFAQGLRPAEVSRIGLDQSGIKLMLADDLVEAVANFGAAVIAIGRLWREFLRISGRLRRFREGPDLLRGAVADAVW